MPSASRAMQRGKPLRVLVSYPLSLAAGLVGRTVGLSLVQPDKSQLRGASPDLSPYPGSIRLSKFPFEKPESFFSGHWTLPDAQPHAISPASIRRIASDT